MKNNMNTKKELSPELKAYLESVDDVTKKDLAELAKAVTELNSPFRWTGLKWRYQCSNSVWNFLSDLYAEFKFDIQWRWEMYTFWTLTGWPFKRRCPQCAGDGVYSSEAQARYNDGAYECGLCCGTGKIKRNL